MNADEPKGEVEANSTPRGWCGTQQVIYNERKEEHIVVVGYIAAVGKAYCIDLLKHPATLITGKTGSGKSNLLHLIINRLITFAFHTEWKFLLIDPKLVEFGYYEQLPHLFLPVARRMEDIEAALTRVANDIDRRIADPSSETIEDLVIIIDEFSDLMRCSEVDIESLIVKIATLGPKQGVYLFIASSIPADDVFTERIKKAIPYRLSGVVPREENSIAFLGSAGAEKLLGDGDMLRRMNDEEPLLRVHMDLITDAEIQLTVARFTKKPQPVVRAETIFETVVRKFRALPDVIVGRGLIIAVISIVAFASIGAMTVNDEVREGPPDNASEQATASSTFELAMAAQLDAKQKIEQCRREIACYRELYYMSQDMQAKYVSQYGSELFEGIPEEVPDVDLTGYTTALEKLSAGEIVLTGEKQTWDRERIDIFKKTLSRPYVAEMRSVFDAYAEGKPLLDYDFDLLIASSSDGSIRYGLDAFDSDYFKSPFALMGVYPHYMEGYDLFIYFTERPDTLFRVWVQYLGEGSDGEVWEMRLIHDTGIPEEEVRALAHEYDIIVNEYGLKR